MIARITRARRWRDAKGQELVEMALTLPLLLVVLLAIVDFGLLFQRQEIITNAAREGVRLASRMNVSDAEVTARVQNYIANAGLPAAPTVTVDQTSSFSGGGVTWPAAQVTVGYDHGFLFLGPFAGFVGGSFSTITLSAQSTMRTERPLPGS